MTDYGHLRLNHAASGTFHRRTKPDNVPKNTKQPKSRPPVGIREKILNTPLPQYSGPYSVGIMDIEVPVRDPRTFSNIQRHGQHLLHLETVLFSVFYPSTFGSGKGKSPEGEKKWSRPTWIPKPRKELIEGYAKFSSLSNLTSFAIFGISNFLVAQVTMLKAI